MKEIEIIVEVIYGEHNINELMHCTDLFEEGKVLGKIELLSITGTENMDTGNLILNLKNALEETKQVFIFGAIVSIDGVKNLTHKPLFKENVQTVSDGKKFGLFKDILINHGYKVEHDEYMRVTNVEMK